MSAPISSKIASDAKHKNPPVVRTLKPPPEIWELVHPVDQKQFNPRQTFIRRLGSASTLSLVALVVGLVLGVCVAVWRFRAVPRSTAVETIQPAQVDSTSSGNDAANPSNNSATATDGTVPEPTTDGNVSDNSRRAIPPSIKRKAGIAVEARQAATGSETTAGVEGNPAPPPPPRSQTRTTDEKQTGATDSNEKSSDSASAKPKSNTSLSPQVIAPVKSDSTRKAKVIQWP